METMNQKSLVFEAANGYARPYTIEYTMVTDAGEERVTHKCGAETPLRRAVKMALDDVLCPVVRDAEGVVVCKGEAGAKALLDLISG